MVKKTFNVQEQDWQEVHALPGSWPLEQLRKVLELAEFDDEVSDADLPEMTAMALQDMKPRLASELVLEAVFGDSMKAGVRQNNAEDLQQDKPWQEFPVLAQQAGVFEAVVLLQKTFPRYFGIPDAVKLTLDVAAADAEGEALLAKPPEAALLLRLLAAGMPDTAVMRRLFVDELACENWPAASGVLWQVHKLPDSDAKTHRFEIYSSMQWLEPLEEAGEWQAKAWPDSPGK